MRRVLIFVMLGIIIYSTFTSLIPSWPEPDSYKMLLDTVYGSVSAGNFSFWTFGQKGPLIIELTSVTGDADLFVGDSLRPSYEADKHNFSSETCGIDLVFVPGDFPRPLVIAVYGNWPYNWSQFSMKVFTDLERLMPGESYVSAPDKRPVTTSHWRMVESSQANSDDKQPMRSEVIARKEDEKPKFLQFYRVLDTMFGLLV